MTNDNANTTTAAETAEAATAAVAFRPPLDELTRARAVELFEGIPVAEQEHALQCLSDRFYHRKPSADEVRLAARFLTDHADSLPGSVTAALVSGDDLLHSVLQEITDRCRDGGWRAITAAWDALDALPASGS